MTPQIPPPHDPNHLPDDEAGMVIPLERPKRLLGLLLWLLAVAVVAAVLVVLFVQFTASLRVALALVLFMLVYMGVMGWLVTRK
jgi:hypothetical protein